MKTYWDDSTVFAGITLKDSNKREDNNMALHVCQNSEDVIYNRHVLSRLLNIPLNNFVFANQTHSNNFHRVTKADLGKGTLTQQDAINDTDALYTYEKNIVLTSFVADCAPILFRSEKSNLVGAIHSGWQGTIKEITRKLFVHLKEIEHEDLQYIHVQIGMCISQNKFEVDFDVFDKFQRLQYADEFMYFDSETNKYHIDNAAVIKKQCLLAGILEHNILIDPTCTFINDNAFSYRQNKSCGRHLAFIYRKE